MAVCEHASGEFFPSAASESLKLTTSAELGKDTVCLGHSASSEWLRARHQRFGDSVLPSLPFLIYR